MKSSVDPVWVILSRLVTFSSYYSKGRRDGPKSLEEKEVGEKEHVSLVEGTIHLTVYFSI